MEIIKIFGKIYSEYPKIDRNRVIYKFLKNFNFIYLIDRI
jgi:hypothetical protein